jgi:hypothetical protein
MPMSTGRRTPRLRLVGMGLIALMLLSLLASVPFVRFMGAHGAELLQALSAQDIGISNPWFHSNGWDGLLHSKGNWGPVEVLWGTSAAFYLPDQSLDGRRVLRRVGDASPFYIVKGDGLCVRLYVTYPVPPAQVEEMLQRLVTGEGSMSVRTRLTYYAQVVSCADARYFGGIPRLWEEGQTVILVLVPLAVLQQALLLLWVPLWALLPVDPRGFVVSWLALVGVLLALGCVLTLSRPPRTPASRPARTSP